MQKDKGVCKMADYRNRILIVDDDKVMLEILTGILSETYELLVCEHGQEVIDRLAEVQRIDLMILDIRMPDIDGYELLAHIKERPAYADTPVIFLTGVTGHEAEIKGLNTGVTDYIVKPFRQEVLMARVNAVLRIAKRLDYTKLPRTGEALSDTELAVLQLLALSYTNEDIAGHMGYTNGYVRQMISRLLQKLGLENRKDVRAFL